MTGYRYMSAVPADVRLWVEINEPDPGDYIVHSLHVRVWDTGKVERITALNRTEEKK